MCRDSESQSHKHTARVALYRCIQKFLDSRKLYDLIKSSANICFCHSEYRTVDIDILSTGKLRMEPGPDLQQAGNAALVMNNTVGWRSDPAENLKQSAFPSAIRANEITWRIPVLTYIDQPSGRGIVGDF